MSWELTQEIFTDWMDKGLPMEKVYSGIRLSDEDVKQMNRLDYQDWEMNENEPAKYTEEQRARAERSNSDFWDDIIKRYGIGRGRPFTIDNHGVVHFYRVAE